MIMLKEATTIVNKLKGNVRESFIKVKVITLCSLVIIHVSVYRHRSTCRKIDDTKLNANHEMQIFWSSVLLVLEIVQILCQLIKHALVSVILFAFNVCTLQNRQWHENA